MLDANVNDGLLKRKKARIEMREKIIHETAFIESALDDPEHISLDGYSDELFICIPS
mgnify:CR=1 FL=1